MKIKRAGQKRIKPGGAHPWFAEHLEVWRNLNTGEVVTIPDDEAESIFALFGDSIVKVNNDELNKLMEGEE